MFRYDFHASFVPIGVESVRFDAIDVHKRASRAAKYDQTQFGLDIEFVAPLETGTGKEVSCASHDSCFPSQPREMVGWLQKKGAGVVFGSGWKRRYFIASGGGMAYFVRPTDVTPKGVIKLVDCEIGVRFYIMQSWRVRAVCVCVWRV